MVVPWALIIGAAGVWATVVFADVVHDMLIHFLWGDILFAAGALEARAPPRHLRASPWARLRPAARVPGLRRGVPRPREDRSWAVKGAHWHLWMGILLIVAGVVDLVRVRLRRPSLIPLTLVPLTAFAFLLIAIPVAAAS